MRSPSYLSGHNQARRRRINRHISCHKANITKLLKHFTVFLIAQSLENEVRIMDASLHHNNRLLTFMGLV
jgi:hypothetical protein